MSDAGLELLIGRVLRIGVTASSICLAAGLEVARVVPGAGLMLLNVGILLLIATPAARVVLSIVEYVIARDWPFTLLTTIVLMELVAGAVAAVLFHKKL
jgi:uncharacterized membrane protein